MAEYTPMMMQYLETKEKYKDCILFYRLGDFYEMFFEDAITASRKELELTLTGKSCGQEERAPMCGIPYHAVDGYLNRLVSKGYRVAICEQVEDPKLAKGIVKREVIRIVTPGTNSFTTALDETKNNYLMQFQSDIARCKVEVSEQEELSGIGTTVMAGIALAIWDESMIDHISRKCYGMYMEEECAERKYIGWKRAIKATIFEE